MVARILLNANATSGLLVRAWFGFTIWAAYSVFYGNRTHLYADNGLIENIQAVLLIIAGLVYLAAAAITKRSDKLILLFCSVVCLTFLLREVDVEDFDIHPVLLFMGHGIGRNTMLVTAFIAIFGYAVLNFSYYTKTAVAFAKSRPGWLLVAGGVCLLVGDFFDKSHGIHHHVFYEEIAELLGHIFILLSSISAISDFFTRTSAVPTATA